MIELYVGEENVDADHIDFKKALDLLDFVNLEDEEKLNIWLHIWCRSIMKNTWTDIDKDNPLESVRDTVFFRLVEFAFMQGKDRSDGLTDLIAVWSSLIGRGSTRLSLVESVATPVSLMP